MPWKDQTICYRTIKDVQWINICDLWSDVYEEAAKAVKKAQPKIRARRINQGGGGYGLFVHPEDQDRACVVFNAVVDELEEKEKLEKLRD